MRKVDLKLQIIHASEFLRMTEKGDVDLEATRQTLGELARAARGMEDYEIMIDARGAVIRRSTIESWEAAADLGKYKEEFRGRKIAILVSGTGEASEFFALCAQNLGYYVKVFHDFEKAINWLFLPTDVSPEALKEPAH